jgi:tRNA(Arg) A34 adenosine deaminase TadA
MNTIGTGDATGHPELALAAWASEHLTAKERAVATLYTSCESCAMCAGGQYWAGIGRLVFALSGAQLADVAPAGVPSLRLSSREVFARGNV